MMTIGEKDMADAHQKHHDYHIIDPSPWPLVGSIGALVMALGGIGWMQGMRGADSLLGLPITNPVLFLVGFCHRSLHHVRLVGRHHQGSPSRAITPAWSACICATA
jgi:hypothetical protein